MQPGSTYRIQLRASFNFAQAAALAPYLRRLGVTHLYCSPYLQAAEGSSHGYDVVDHSRLNHELGGSPGYDLLRRALAAQGLGQVLDIVPNHMSIAGRANRWWWDVLENGPSSLYADAFDIDWWTTERSEPTVLVPVLGDHYGRVIDAGELQLSRDHDRIVVRYHEHELPTSRVSVQEVLSSAALACGSGSLEELALAHRALPVGGKASAGEHAEKEHLRERLGALCHDEPRVAEAIDAELAAIDADPDRMDLFLSRQNYRLAFWRTASEELDYRRFFNIESLVGLRVENPHVFAASHALVLQLVTEGCVSGLRIDHIDGLLDPLGYLQRLREAAGGAYTVVEKILERDETLPTDWPIAGTSGYDFLARVNNLYVASENEAALSDCYSRFSGETTPYAEVVHAAKCQVMVHDLRAEVDSLTRLLAEICERHRRHRDHTRRELRTALMEFLAAYPVYRTYLRPDCQPSPEDRATIAAAVAGAKQRREDVDTELLEFLGELALLQHPGADETEFALRLAQVSAPVMAKGVEDTAFYRYHRLISLNEVGGDPAVFGCTVADFHTRTARDAAAWPHGMHTLSTHDTKRSADVRARLHVLSEIPAAWEQAAGSFAEINQAHRSGDFPDRNIEYMLYQTLVGAWPLDVERTLAFMRKATCEAKVHTSWADGNAEYDTAVERFVRGALNDSVFLQALSDFLDEQHLVERGRLNSLSQTTLLLTCPGVPDVYQGSELWDLSLVDPDNRRPVDYARREQLLIGLEGAMPSISLAEDSEGLHKLAVVSRLLAHRRENADLYASCTYQPLSVHGERAAHAVAFARGDLVVVVPRLVVGLADGWGDTTVPLPEGSYHNVLTGETLEGGEIELAALLNAFPVTVLQRGRV